MPTEVSTGHTAKLNGREQVAEGTMAFYFDKPNGFEFRAGQALDITLLNPPETDSEGNIRTFSIASAPLDRKSTRLNSSHGYISYAVFCLKKKTMILME